MASVRSGVVKTFRCATYRMLDAERKSAHALGATCAADGGSYESNPFRDGDADPLVYMAWINGFRENQTFDPVCSICSGTGKRVMRSVYSDPNSEPSPYDGLHISCDCNVASPT